MGVKWGARVCQACFAAAVMFGGTTDGAADFGGFGPFARSLNDKPYGYQVIADPTGTAPVPEVERFEVRPGDCGAEANWDDCAQDRERSELSERGARNPLGSEFWYRWHLYVPEDYPNVFPAKVGLGQFHQEGSHPLFMFQNDAGGYWLDDHRSGKTDGLLPLIDEADLRGRWHRITVHAYWTTGEGGFFRVWVNDEQKVALNGPTMAGGGKVYFKYGLYRSFVSRWSDENAGAPPPAQVVLYAGVSRANSREGLAGGR